MVADYRCYVLILRAQGFSSDGRQTAYVIALILSLGFAICISYVKEAEINKKKCGDDREQYSSIVPMTDMQQQYKSIDGDEEDGCEKEESMVDKLTPKIWKLNRVRHIYYIYYMEAEPGETYILHILYILYES